MKIKEVSAGVKISKNYNSYSMNLVADLDFEESPGKVGEILMEKAMEIINNKLGEKMDFEEKVKFKQKEVGAAWPHKKSSNFFSVKMSETGKWEDVRIEDLEKTNEGYFRKTSEGIFVFRKIPEEKRKSNKMPLFRIYKKGDKNEK